MDTINDFQKQIYKTIDILTEEKLKHLGFDKTKKGTVVSVGLDTCKVKINGEDFTCKMKQGSQIKAGEIVFVKFPQNKDNERYIDATLKSSSDGEYLAMTANQILELLLTVDGAGSGLDADLLDGKHGSEYATKEEVQGLVSMSYTHHQITPKIVWSVEHNLGRYPSTTVVDSGGNVVIGNVQHIDENNLSVNFTAEFSGKAYLN